MTAGAYELPDNALPAGRYEVRYRYAGDQRHWPASVTTEQVVR